MKSVIKALLLCLIVSKGAAAQSPLREEALREAAKRSGVVPLESILIPQDPELVAIGRDLFESPLLSLNSDTSCQTCHIDRFGSADGLPNAVGTGGKGEGPQRLKAGGGDIVPRNTLPFWGRGTKGFDTFFWDGKVKATEDGVTSQFGRAVPSNDPLVVAVHLPFVEIRELVVRDANVSSAYEMEEPEAAARIYNILADRVRKNKDFGPRLSAAIGKPVPTLEFRDIASAVAAFIRDKFAVRKTRFHSFLFEGGKLSADEVAGGLIFYGKGRCSSCHSGPLMSDLEFHAMPFEQLGFGKNGFGVDYGRYNVTKDAADLYLFRTPPLINVEKTAPYTHSGALADLPSVIRAHTDPLAGYNGAKRTPVQRREDLARLLAWQGASQLPEPLTEREVSSLVAFLRSLSVEE